MKLYFESLDGVGQFLVWVKFIIQNVTKMHLAFNTACLFRVNIIILYVLKYPDWSFPF